jgi:predicted ester cyclase
MSRTCDFQGMPATGKRFSTRGVTILELQAGKIRRNSDYWDAAGVMRQVGLLRSSRDLGNTSNSTRGCKIN